MMDLWPFSETKLRTKFDIIDGFVCGYKEFFYEITRGMYIFL